MDFGGLLLLGLLWFVFRLFQKGGAPPDGADRPRPPVLEPDAAGGDSTQREGHRLEAMLRDLLEEAEVGVSRPASQPLPSAEEVEDRTTLEVEPEVVSLEPPVVRPARAELSQDTGAEETARHRLTGAAARNRRLTAADHRAFDERIRAEPDHTAVHVDPRNRLRDAVVWAEILGRPKGDQ